MRCDGFAFTDVVSGCSVYYFTDVLGRSWLAENAWARFRVERHTAAQRPTEARDDA
jgi:hypothetical protein